MAWYEKVITIRGTPAQFVALAIEVSRYWKESHEGLMWYLKGYMQSGLFHVYEFTPGGAGVTVRINANERYPVNQEAREWPYPGYSWIDARSLPTLPGEGETTELTASLLWPGTDDKAKCASWAWSKLHEALVAADLIVKDEETTTPAQEAKGDASDKGSDIAKRRREVLKLWNERPAGESREAFKRRVAPSQAVSESTIRDDLRCWEKSGQIK